MSKIYQITDAELNALLENLSLELFKTRYKDGASIPVEDAHRFFHYWVTTWIGKITDNGFVREVK